MRTHCAIWAVALGLLFSLPASGTAAPIGYRFTLIADIPTQGTISPPAINNNGIVAFTVTPDGAAGSGVFAGSGGLLTTIVAGSASLAGFTGVVSINSGGTVAFAAAAGAQGIYTGNGGPLTIISPSFFGGDPSINDLGTVAFFGSGSVLAGSGGATTTIATLGGPFHGFIGGAPAINNAGTVTFLADLGGNAGVFTGSGTGNTITISTGIGSINIFPSISAAGTVAFSGTFLSGDTGIFVGSGGLLTTIADTADGFASFGTPSINDNGLVAFSAFLAGGGEGIFTGSDPVADKVIRTGDRLFGSTFTGLTPLLGPEALNDVGQIAFVATLENGRTVVARADPVLTPEPSTISLVAVGALAVFSYVRRRRLHP